MLLKVELQDIALNFAISYLIKTVQASYSWILAVFFFIALVESIISSSNTVKATVTVGVIDKYLF